MQACMASSWSLTFPVLVMLMLCLGGILFAYWVTRQRDFPGRNSFILLLFSGLWWLLCASFEHSVMAAECKMFLSSMAWLGRMFTVTFWTVFLWQYVNSANVPIPGVIRVVLGLMPVVVWLIALSNPWHNLFYLPGSGPVLDSPSASVRYLHGPLFYASAAYVYLLMTFCMGMVIRAALLSQGLLRRHYLGFILVMALPWAGNISYVVFGVTVQGVDPTPFCFALTLGSFAWLIAGVRLFDLLPVARHLLLDALLDPVLVVDAQLRVIEANPAALKLACQGSGWQGRPLADWPILGADLQQLLSEPVSRDREFVLPLANSARYFEVRIRVIERSTHRGPVILGQMLYLRDVTQRHLSELKLAEALALSEERLRTITSLHAQLQEQALCDPLTGLYNRRYLDEFFARELAVAQRERTPISLAMIDLDHFKQLNDEHGHLEGDDVLKGVAQHLLANLRSSDAVFRIGGEEFLLILPRVDAHEARMRLETICRELAAHPLPTRGGARYVTFSAGLALWPEQGLVLDELLQTADTALYQAKHAGRNRVCSLV
jgi:diguanylate cyclase (GGDEF)-like protein